MGKASRDKGARGERKIVNRLKEIGLESKRVPLSGSAGGIFSGDILTYLPLVDPEQKSNMLVVRGEVKWRKDAKGFKTIEGWLGRNEILFLLKDRADPMVVLPWKTFEAIYTGQKGINGDSDEENGREGDPVPSSLEWPEAQLSEQDNRNRHRNIRRRRPKKSAPDGAG